MPETVDLAHSSLEDLWAQDDTVSAADRARFETAVIEVVGNIVEHAFRLDEDDAAGERLLEISLSVTSDKLEAALSDNGLPVELDLSRATMPGPEAVSGRGLPLAIAALDQLRYERDGGRNRWTLTCERRAG